MPPNHRSPPHQRWACPPAPTDPPRGWQQQPWPKANLHNFQQRLQSHPDTPGWLSILCWRCIASQHLLPRQELLLRDQQRRFLVFVMNQVPSGGQLAESCLLITPQPQGREPREAGMPSAPQLRGWRMLNPSFCPKLKGRVSNSVIWTCGSECVLLAVRWEGSSSGAAQEGSLLHPWEGSRQGSVLLRRQESSCF